MPPKHYTMILHTIWKNSSESHFKLQWFCTFLWHSSGNFFVYVAKVWTSRRSLSQTAHQGGTSDTARVLGEEKGLKQVKKKAKHTWISDFVFWLARFMACSLGLRLDPTKFKYQQLSTMTKPFTTHELSCSCLALYMRVFHKHPCSTNLYFIQMLCKQR